MADLPGMIRALLNYGSQQTPNQRVQGGFDQMFSGVPGSQGKYLGMSADTPSTPVSVLDMFKPKPDGNLTVPLTPLVQHELGLPHPQPQFPALLPGAKQRDPDDALRPDNEWILDPSGSGLPDKTGTRWLRRT